MTLSYDLHIHSCLSPCGSEDMTPENIAGMAALKQLDIIAVTDHNSCKNCEPVITAASKYGITAIPGMEICTLEEVHALCLFASLEDAMTFDNYVYERLPRIPNNEKIFGSQQRYGSDDQFIDYEPYLLINGVNISFDELWQLVNDYHGLMIPAHIDKASNSLISNLGFVPPDSQFTCVELKNLANLHGLMKLNPYLGRCRIISNSDAHYLEDINEPELTIEVESRNLKDILAALAAPILK